MAISFHVCKTEKVKLRRGKEWRSVERSRDNKTCWDGQKDKERHRPSILVSQGLQSPGSVPHRTRLHSLPSNSNRYCYFLPINFSLWCKLVWMDSVNCNLKTSTKPEMNSLSCQDVSGGQPGCGCHRKMSIMKWAVLSWILLLSLFIAQCYTQRLGSQTSPQMIFNLTVLLAC